MTGEGAVGAGHAPGLWPVPGDGVLARYGSLILLSSLDDGQFVDVLLDTLEQLAAAGGDGRRFADAVADVIENAAEPAGDDPSVLAFGATGAGLAVTVSGGAWAEVTTAHGTARVQATHPGMLTRSVLRWPATAVRGGLRADDNGSASTDRFSRLDAGTVRAGGLLFVAAGAAVAAPAAPAAGAGRPSLAKQAPEGGAAVGGPEARVIGAAEEAAEELADEDRAEEQLTSEELAEELAADELAGPAQEAAPGEAMVPEAEPAPVRHEPTAAWIPPSDVEQQAPAGAAGPPGATEQWSPPWAADEQPVGGSDNVTALPEAGSGYEGEPFEAVQLSGAGQGGVEVPARGPLPLARDVPAGTSSYVSQGPIIQGVYCKNGHFDDPEALFCAICGISMNQQTLVPRPGERPPLGVLLLDDGSVFQLDSEYVVGREPSLDASVAAGRARPLRVADDSGIVSRVHARVQLDGWRVTVTDLGSANGTRVRLPAQGGEQQLAPQVPVVLATGSQVDLGGRSFRYESHRGR